MNFSLIVKTTPGATTVNYYYIGTLLVKGKNTLRRRLLTRRHMMEISLMLMPTLV